MSIVRSRLTQEESRTAALAAAGRLLLERGPQAVTLKAVAAEIGRTHANLLHHFGSAAGLQAELARSIAGQVTASIAESVERARSHETDAREIVDKTFDAFGHGGGALAAWMILSGNRDALNPILEALKVMVQQLSVDPEDHRHVAGTTLWLVLMAVGDSLLGQPIAEALSLPRETARTIAAESLGRHLDERYPPED